MKRSLCLALALLASAPAIATATKIGDTAQEVLVERGQPEARIANGDSATWVYRHDLIELRGNRVTAVSSLVPSPARAAAPAAAAAPTAAASTRAPILEPAAMPQPGNAAGRPAAPPMDPIAAARAEQAAAIARVMAIINQPVRPAGSSSRQASRYKGWFHPGAMVPDFDNVDVRQTQECSYDAHPLVTNTERPGLVFRGSDLEFNSMTKVFYADRSVPKKKLTEAEMLEVNRLYRIIGRTQKIIGQPAISQAPAAG